MSVPAHKATHHTVQSERDVSGGRGTVVASPETSIFNLVTDALPNESLECDLLIFPIFPSASNGPQVVNSSTFSMMITSAYLLSPFDNYPGEVWISLSRFGGPP